MLRMIGWTLAGIWLAGALVLVRRAPAVSLALMGSLAVGVDAFLYIRPDGPRGVPLQVASWSCVALLACGLLGLVITRPRASRTGLRRLALVVAVVAPFAALGLGLLLAEACPFYRMSGAGLCFHRVDVLGGWVSQVAVLFAFDLFVVAAILMVAASQVHPTTTDLGRG